MLKSNGVAPYRHGDTKNLSPAARAAYRRIDLRFHDLRHECASRWLDGGFRPDEVQALLGRKDITTTYLYLNIRPGAMEARLRQYDEARSGKRGKDVAIGSLPGFDAETGEPSETARKPLVN